MRIVDDIVIDRIFQPVVNWCGCMFGWTQWGIAKQANYAGLACCILHNGFRLVDGKPVLDMTISVDLGLWWFFTIKKQMDRFQATSHGASISRSIDWWIRLIMLSIVVIPLPVTWALFGLIDAKLIIDTCALYLMACGNPPPKRVRHTIHAMAGAS